ncbi:NTP pyrophosphohydrolase [Actinosynnema pretiosum subsp. pretiosum]|uniref:NTP pyrophosphohydrolase n=1 Tax=Actinosynnema pretiosum subsp. pretiosum TaxID=103721 RepID=A0AA45L388_9PSEU|nr:hypothetical protein APASM_6904 [Actinosynnema pretiosum subsp. pretiosum]QUF02020.1 NTP pyrophosphohydrolase [Actinosynnema pretiosum subsp. pretiosum]
MTDPLLVVDGANVVGSVPDGWWRDRAAAAERLRDSLVRVSTEGVPPLPGPLEVVLVVEGRAKHVESVPGVHVVAAEASGDDKIVALVAEAAPRPCTVVTADRELKDRVRALGAHTLGPKSVR